MIGPKYDLRLVDKLMLQVVDRPCEIIFFLLGIQKCDLDAVDEAMFQVVEWPVNSFSAFWMSKNASLVIR
jgi:hypothetical protein